MLVKGVRVEQRDWSVLGAQFLGRMESAVLVLIGVVLVAVALLLLGSSCVTLYHAVTENVIRRDAIEILDSVLLVMMTMEIVYTVAISLRSHTLVAEPFLIIGAIAAIRRMLVITATTNEGDNLPSIQHFRNTLMELALLAGTVVAIAVSIYILRKSQKLYPPDGPEQHNT
jgi:phosphate starvation-inducible membrane PsiE